MNVSIPAMPLAATWWARALRTTAGLEWSYQ
jgi:hypothetical protein